MTKQKKEKEDLEKIQEDLINKNKKQELANKKSQEEAAALQKQKVLLEKKIAALKKKPTINKKIRNSKNYTKEQIEIAQYKISIRDKVYQNWRKPKWAKKDWTCMASIVQNRFGRILKAEVHSCNYNHSSFRGSIETAISRSSPLPLPINDDFFEKNINITFIVN
jgi:TolA protein